MCPLNPQGMCRVLTSLTVKQKKRLANTMPLIHDPQTNIMRTELSFWPASRHMTLMWHHDPPCDSF